MLINIIYNIILILFVILCVLINITFFIINIILVTYLPVKEFMNNLISSFFSNQD